MDWRDKVASGIPLHLVDEPGKDIRGRLEPTFGCQPWSRTRSPHRDGGTSHPGAKRTLVGIGPDGREIRVEVCETCGSGIKQDGRDRLSHAQFCAACERSLRDQEIKALLRAE